MSLLLLTGQSQPNPRTLFANGEQGLAIGVEEAYLRGWVYQDAAGATVAAAAGDPVGLILDTSKGGLDQLGSDLVSNGTFASDTVWTKGANWTIGSGVATKTGGAANDLTQTISSTAGRWYRITMDVTRTAGTLTVSLGTSGTTRAISATGSYTFYILAGSSTQTLTLAGDSSFAGTVDNVTARLVPGNHAYVTASGSRPVLAKTPDGGRRNTLLQTENFSDDAVWTKLNGSITGTTASSPLGNVADTFTVSSAGGTAACWIRRLTQPIASGQPVTLSVYAKKTNNDWFFLRLEDTAVGTAKQAFFNLATGAKGTVDSGATSDVQSAGDGWYRCSISFASTLNTTIGYNFGPAAADGTQTVTRDGVISVLVVGSQAETSGSATAYQKVGLTSDVEEQGRRSCYGLLFDGSDDFLQTSSIDFATWTAQTRRNLLVDTESFGTSSWTKTGSSITENAIAAPDGTTTADKLVENSASSAHIADAYTVTPTSGVAYTGSVYLKAGERGWAILQFECGGNNTYAYVNLSTGAFGTPVGTGATFSSVDAGNGWWRCIVTATTSSTATGGIRVYLATNGSTFSYLGDGASGIYLWGAQFELGSTPTDYQRVGTDKMTVMAGVRKLSDAASAMLVELSTSTGSNAGSFYVTSPESSGSKDFAFYSRGSVAPASPVKTGSLAAPYTGVITGTGDIGNDAMVIRSNGVQSSSSSSDQGSGNFGNYVLYIGRRGGTTLPFNGILYTLIVRGATTPTGTIADFERNLLARRCGVTF